MQLVFKYAAFAVIATLVNLLAQELTDRVSTGVYVIYWSIAAGTVAGWVCKYQLDKHFIFAYRSQSMQDDAQKFLAYGMTGVITTLLFWGFELGFDYWIGSKPARYLGAVIGLPIGYGVKYRLDKRHGFSKQET